MRGAPLSRVSSSQPSSEAATVTPKKGNVANIENPRLAAEFQRKQLDLLGELNKNQLAKDKVNPDLEGLIESYELAFRMEGAVPQVMDVSSETKATQDAYGIGDKGTDNFGRQCLLARRFVEAGVRFVELEKGGLGSAQQPEGQSDGQCPRYRPADWRPAARPETTRPAERHACRLGRRVWPDAGGPE